MMNLTRDDFQEFKAAYDFYGTHTETDDYGNEFQAVNSTVKKTIHTMWHPLDDRLMIAEYGRDFDKVLYAIVYDMGPHELDYGDRVTIYGEEYEISAIRIYNTHIRIDVKRLKVG